MSDIEKIRRGRKPAAPGTTLTEQIPLRLLPGTLARIRSRIGDASLSAYVRGLIERDLAEPAAPKPTPSATNPAKPDRNSPLPSLASRLDKTSIGRRR